MTVTTASWPGSRSSTMITCTQSQALSRSVRSMSGNWRKQISTLRRSSVRTMNQVKTSRMRRASPKATMRSQHQTSLSRNQRLRVSAARIPRQFWEPFLSAAKKNCQKSCKNTCHFEIKRKKTVRTKSKAGKALCLPTMSSVIARITFF